MTRQAVELLNPSARQIFIDATLGGGGHSEALLSSSAGVKLFAFDRDSDAIEAAKKRLAEFPNITYIHDNFASLKAHVKEKVDGILFDLGVSSYQLDEAARGFSLQKDGPLDMRMNKDQKLTAADLVNNYAADELTRIFKEYGEERFAKRISSAIGVMRNAKSIETTFELKAIIEKAIPVWKKRESVTRIFQALRLAVNDELGSLLGALNDAVQLLKPGGRLVVIAYHSLEDRIVKQTFRAAAKNGILRLFTKKPQRPSADEVAANPRSKSAKLRAAFKL